MSGGHFDYTQREILMIRESIRSIINNNGKKVKEESNTLYFSEDSYNSNFSEETIEEFKKALEILRQAYVYSQRIDWLLSSDDSEESFKIRLREDLENYNP